MLSLQDSYKDSLEYVNIPYWLWIMTKVKDLSGTGNTQLMFYTMGQEKEVSFF